MGRGDLPTPSCHHPVLGEEPKQPATVHRDDPTLAVSSEARGHVTARRTPEDDAGAAVEVMCANRGLCAARLTQAVIARQIASKDFLQQTGDRIRVSVHTILSLYRALKR
jgi:hypothetical protein